MAVSATLAASDFGAGATTTALGRLPATRFRSQAFARGSDLSDALIRNGAAAKLLPTFFQTGFGRRKIPSGLASRCDTSPATENLVRSGCQTISINGMPVKLSPSVCDNRLK